LVVGLYVSLVS